MIRIPLISGDEYEALTSAKADHRWRPGQRKRIKRGYSRRFRRAAASALLGD
jgi:hypothetical protein